MPSPTIMGHEGAGVVEAIGQGVTALDPGDHVIMTWFYPCGTCSSCRQGRAWVCTGSQSEACLLPDGTSPAQLDSSPAYPYLAVGSMSEHVVVAEQAAIRVPKEVPFDVAALIGCSIATGVGAVVNDARVQPGRSALVIGAGGVGLSIIMGLALAGASPIIAADVTDDALELARAFGATDTIRSDASLPVRVREIVPDGADFAFEAIGRPETIALMPTTLQRGGTAVVVGLPPEGRPVPIDVLALAEEGKSLLGSNYGSTVPARDFPMLARLYLDGRLPVDRLITNRFALEDVNEAFDLMRAGARGRSVLIL
jgi:S-(hydroxymethyl)glutathione dehydrogenase/alcohol dehydrogenase